MCAPAADIQGLYWSKTAQGCQLSVQRSQERLVQLTGFREKARFWQAAPVYFVLCSGFVEWSATVVP